MSGPLQPRVGAAWRPWGVDTLATVIARTPAAVTIRYDHAEQQTHTLRRDEFFGGMGREVRRGDYLRGRTDAAKAALARLEAAYAADTREVAA